MKDNIYQFPVGEQKNAFKNAVSAKRRKEQRNKAISKTGALLRRFLDWSFFLVRLGLATGLHIVACLPFTALIALRKPIFWIGGLICVITYYHYTIPFLVSAWILSFVSLPVLAFLNNRMPFHHLLGLESTQEKSHTETEC
ncbi:hypothetical protein D2D48_004665 [Escherichia coli]|nr:hypothetical protein [Escherichia coli]